jgi:hypothetical protein
MKIRNLRPQKKFSNIDPLLTRSESLRFANALAYLCQWVNYGPATLSITTLNMMILSIIKFPTLKINGVPFIIFKYNCLQHPIVPFSIHLSVPYGTHLNLRIPISIQYFKVHYCTLLWLQNHLTLPNHTMPFDTSLYLLVPYGAL